MLARRVPLACAACIAAAVALSAASARAVDADADSVDDVLDNCIGKANSNQADTDADGYGNACDADFNNDGFVNPGDIGDLKRLFLTPDKLGDFNQDLTVNSLDIAPYRTLFQDSNANNGGRPGPSKSVPDPALDTQAPRIDLIQVSPAAPLGPRGENGIAKVTFAPGQTLGPTVPASIDGKVVVLNDVQLAPDTQAGDGIYSAYLAIDTVQIAQDQQGFTTRLNGLPATPSVLDYGGREITGGAAFAPPSAPAAAQALSAASSTVVNAAATSADSRLLKLPPTVHSSNSLLINDPAVVAHPTYTFDPCNTDNRGNASNPNARWSFKTLLANMIPRPNGVAPSDAQIQVFIHSWLRNFVVQSTVVYSDGTPGFTIDPRLRANGQPGVKDYFPGWDGVDPTKLDVNRLPFRLLAIVNRMDLAKVRYSSSGGGDEIRFVFGLLDINDATSTCKVAADFNRATVILEYGVPRSRAFPCKEWKADANTWIGLHTIASNTNTPRGSDVYMAELLKLTDKVTQPGAGAALPLDTFNGSALNQLRTNETAFDGRNGLSSIWELREFKLAPSTNSVSPLPDGTALLSPSAIRQTPDLHFRDAIPGSPLGVTIQHFVEQKGLDLLCDRHVVPEIFESAKFLGSSISYSTSGTRWSIIPEDTPPFDAVIQSIVTGDAASACFRLSQGLNIAPAELLDPSRRAQATATIQSEARHKLSIGACDDCHAGETNTPFVHVDPATRSVSGFLGVSDPLQTDLCSTGAANCISVSSVPEAQLGAGAHREYNELRRRGQILDLAATKSCIEFLMSDITRVSSAFFVH